MKRDRQLKNERPGHSLYWAFVFAIGLAVLVSAALRFVASQAWSVAACSGAFVGVVYLLGALQFRCGAGYAGLERLPLACGLLDENRRLCWINDPVREMFAIADDSWRGQPWELLLSADKAAAEEIAAWPDEGVRWGVTRPDGVALTVQYQIVPLNDGVVADGEAKFLLLLRDADRLLAGLRDETEASRLRTAACLASQIAHEVRNPVAAISGSAQLLGMLSDKARNGDPRSQALLIHEQDALCRSIVEESNRLDAIIARFLSFSDLSESSLRTIMDMPDRDEEKHESAVAAHI